MYAKVFIEILVLELYIYWCWFKYVKDVVGVNVNISVGWVVENCVGAVFDRTYVDELYSGIGDEVGEGFD